MKKLMISLALVSLLALTATGIALAQEPVPTTPPEFGHGYRSGGGLLHNYMIKNMADLLGMQIEELSARLESGERLSQISYDLGLNPEEFLQIKIEARLNALDEALADGAISQEQYNFMLEHGQNGQGMGMGMGPGSSNRNGQGNGVGRHGQGNGTGPIEDCPFYSENTPTN